MIAKKIIPRDISWLSFNARVLQEANDNTVPLQQRIRFLGIFSNNSDEFFRVRVATLKRMIEFSEKRKKLNMHLENNPQKILDEIQTIVLQQQNEFNRIWTNIIHELKKEKIFIKTEKQLTKTQQTFVQHYFEENIRSSVIPLMIQSLTQLPYLREKSIYLGVVMSKQETAYQQQYALIEVPVKNNGRFIILPSPNGEKHIILLEDILRYNLPYIFSYFGFEQFNSWIFKVTKDAEIELDNDLTETFIQRMEKGLKNRRKGKTVRFVYDKEMDAGLLQYLVSKLELNRKSNIIPGGRIHNFRHFMDFPSVSKNNTIRKKPFEHPLLKINKRVTDVIEKQDVLLHFPYHNFNGIIDLLREAAIDPTVISIKITAYRLAENSKVINALINAARNGKEVVVMLELKARFDEEANLEWKEILEDEGVKVLLGVPKMKVHAKLCVIKKRKQNKILHYGFVSTGNLNEKTATVYADHCLLTSNATIMNDVNRVFNYLQNWQKGDAPLKQCKTLLLCPNNLRNQLITLINNEIKSAKKNKPASIIIKTNSLSDAILIQKLQDAHNNGVQVSLIVRGIYCAVFHNKKSKPPIKAISIVDEYLEHARVFAFGNNGKPKVYLSSADWMVRNLDHRIEAAVPILNPKLQTEILQILQIQLSDNVKARLLDNNQLNKFVERGKEKPIRSQQSTYAFLEKKAKASH
ncbi:MAG: polyphosphate kinase 1 [Chitinophagaceae bacterium]